MPIRSRKSSVTTYLLLFTLFTYLLNYISDGRYSHYFILDIQAIINDYEFWRLLTFPFVPSSFEGTMFFTVIFFMFASKIETILSRKYFFFLIILLIFVQGASLTLFYWGENYYFKGMEGVSLVIISMFTLLNIKKRVSFAYIKHLRIFNLSGLIIMGWIFSACTHFWYSQDESLIYQTAGSFIFGSTLALIIATQIRLTGSFKHKLRHFKSEHSIPKPEELSMALISRNELRRLNETLMEEKNVLQDYDFVLNEDHLNEILDKINEKGKDSLSFEEQIYLFDYSRNL